MRTVGIREAGLGWVLIREVVSGLGLGLDTGRSRAAKMTGDGRDGESWSGLLAVELRRPYYTSPPPALWLGLCLGLDLGRCDTGKGWEMKITSSLLASLPRLLLIQP